MRHGIGGARSSEPDQIRLMFFYPADPDCRSGDPWLQFEYVVAVDDTAVPDQVERLVDQLRTADPRTQADLVGGGPHDAERLGYPWLA
jgi:hypothetical protein